MKYTYFYKTSDGVRHEDVIRAESREDVFATLRSQGIKAIKVVAADGSKANGEIRGIRKRIVVIIALAAAILSAVIAFSLGGRKGASGFGGLSSFDSTIRRQVIGDAAIIEKGILTGWADTFPCEGDRFFASFAIPGVRAGQRNTTEGELKAALNRVIRPDESDGLEARQIKAMVEGMKAEARAYLTAGGSLVDYGKRLTERQDSEIALYERTKVEIDAAKKTMSGSALVAFWEQRNDQLRNLGLKLISLED